MHSLLLSLLTTTSSLSSALYLPQQIPFNAFSSNLDSSPNANPSTETCPLAPKLIPKNDGLHPAVTFVQDPSVRAQQVERLSKAVQVPTTVTDFMTDPFDEGFDVFVQFQDALEDLFPRVHSQMTLEKTNRLSLIYTLPGSNPTLKPLLFMAHQDVVPISSASDWTHPPFSGFYNTTDDFLWGRGASDCKNVLIALLSVLEDLLSQSFTPARTIILAFGFDEESHGFLGAGSIAPFLEARYGADGLEFILDEGGMGLQTLGDVVYALPGVAEKGAVDLAIDLNVTGGHSSIPPPHTGIGIMAEAIHALERERLFEPCLGEHHPKRRVLECQARYSAADVEDWLGDALRDADTVAAAEKIAAARGDAVRFILQSSQAVDMVRGGVKANALPEKVSSIVNYRVALHETPEAITARAAAVVGAVAARHNLTFAHPGLRRGTGPPPVVNHVALYPLSAPLEPAPVSPADLGSGVWRRFSGVARGVFERAFGKRVVVVGDIMTGNTDTRFYWNLSRNIYRWSPTVEGGAVNIHTVDERIKMEAHLQGMMVYYDLIRGFDGEDA